MAGRVAHHPNVSQKTRWGRVVQFPAGTHIIDAVCPSRKIYLLNSGQVQLMSGPKAVVEMLSPGSFFGEKCFMAGRQCDQIATPLSPVIVTAYRRTELLHRLQQDGRFARRLLKNLAVRMDSYEQAIRAFVTERGERRLALLLFRFAPTRPATDWVRLPLRGTNIEVARMVGITRWRASHFLNQFRRMGWLNRVGQELWIHREGLKEFLDATARDGRGGSVARKQ